MPDEPEALGLCRVDVVARRAPRGSCRRRRRSRAARATRSHVGGIAPTIDEGLRIARRGDTAHAARARIKCRPRSSRATQLRARAADTDWVEIAGALRRIGAHGAVAGRRVESGGRGRDGRWPRRRAGVGRRDRCERRPRRVLPVAGHSSRPLAPPAPIRSRRRRPTAKHSTLSATDAERRYLSAVSPRPSSRADRARSFAVTEFERRVLAVVDELQPGQLVSYGWVASEAGKPERRGRWATCWANCADDARPWWRVVQANGRIVSPRRRRTAGPLVGRRGGARRRPRPRAAGPAPLSPAS